MTATPPTPRNPQRMKLAHVLRAIIKALALFVAFNLVYRACQPVQTAQMPTLYNTVVNGRARLSWGSQIDMTMLLDDHEIQRASPDTWNIAVFGSSETYGWPADYRLSAPYVLNAWPLETHEGQPVRVYNLSIPSGDVWKDLMVAEQTLQSGLPVDLLVFNFYAYAFETDYPHPIVIHNPALARTIIETYGIDPSWLAYLPEVGVQTFWTEREVLAYWVGNQVEALNWQIAPDTAIKPNAVPLSTHLDVKKLPITRADFMQALRKMSEVYGVGVLVINVPRPFAEDEFSEWIETQAADNQVALLNCEFVFEPDRFYDDIHMLPDAYPDYARVLINHLASPDMARIAPQLPLRQPADFTPPDETCVFQPAS